VTGYASASQNAFTISQNTTVTVGASAPVAQPLSAPNVATPASGLTSVQANAILSLLSSFGADSAVIASVRAVLFGTSASVAAPSTGLFTRDLDLGAKGDDVKVLQEFLIEQGGGFATQHLSAIGASGYFGTLTQAALAEYQAIQGITPSTGYFGPKTRNSIQQNRLLGN
jgi:peptidoglycan hydrolase-like protein with peptidoglycan-binding domain